MSGRPPAMAEWLMSLSCAHVERDAVLGDLEESFHKVAAAAGRRTACRWYWRQTVASVMSNLGSTAAIWRSCQGEPIPTPCFNISHGKSIARP